MINRKIIIYTALALMVVLVAVLWAYESIQSDNHREEHQAIETALANTEMTQARAVETFVGNQSYKIVFGENMEGRKLIVWIGVDGDIHSEYETDGFGKKQIENILLANDDIELIRMTPGKLQDKYVWEVFYKKKEKKSTYRYYYHYYDFIDGQLIETLTLS